MTDSFLKNTIEKMQNLIILLYFVLFPNKINNETFNKNLTKKNSKFPIKFFIKLNY